MSTIFIRQEAKQCHAKVYKSAIKYYFIFRSTAVQNHEMNATNNSYIKHFWQPTA